MKLDSEDQREILLKLIAASTIPGNAIELMHELLMAIKNAEIVKP